ncbi:hypothetical protein TCAL_12235 [Tigriopus californicus]|uniref:Cytochrome b5 heme-binding domain-containing protein n=1 Tax=Tigriopus californicus TaxID=6832 RepID=A0A553PEZ2_TIGCA|nr:uncharacterized protein LOC131880918 [Tigriopus californicus]TRY76255.1 hypothetical protein TCAL_12235 [Tigriopus californicus]|eukprot:TCALIF_12235-PA protein Name:"Similar to fadA Delta(5) fatty acid desaturase A (Dictyostelium discoideum)" AED:0.02 eAED:0.02 QI:101/1/1/1/1/1/4/130/441
MPDVGKVSDTQEKLPWDHIRIGNKSYDANKLSSFHPGGPLFISAFAGRDASQAFVSYHRKPFPHQKVKFALEKEDQTIPSPDPHLNDEFFELVRRVEKVLPRQKSFATWGFYLKALILLTICFGSEAYMHYTVTYKWYLTGLLGMMEAIMALNITHDALHGSLSANPRVNRFFSLFHHVYSGTVTTWVHQHVVQHHVHTNDIHRDPDISGQRAMRLNPLRPLKKMHAYQYIYFFALFFIYGLTIFNFTISTVAKAFYFTSFSPMLQKYRIFDAIGLAIFHLRWTILPVYQTQSLLTLFHTVPLMIGFGTYMATFFHISHNFEGVEQFEDSGPRKSWLYHQVASSSNVAGTILCTINGGLNYQIEHHLFPRVYHGHYPTIAPIVRQFCEERSIPYRHFPTLSENMLSTVKHMYDFGVNKVPDAAKNLKGLGSQKAMGVSLSG